MIVQIPGLPQLPRKAVHADQRRPPIRNLRRQRPRVIRRPIPGLVSFPILPDALAHLRIQPLPVVPPGKFVHQLARIPRSRHRPQRMVPHLRQRQHPMPQIRRKPRHIPIQKVPAPLIAPRLHLCQHSQPRRPPAAPLTQTHIRRRKMRKHRTHRRHQLVPRCKLLQFLIRHPSRLVSSLGSNTDPGAPGLASETWVFMAATAIQRHSTPNLSCSGKLQPFHPATVARRRAESPPIKPRPKP